MYVRELKVVYGDKVERITAENGRIDSPRKVHHFLMPIMAGATVESFYVVYLNNKNEIQGYSEVSRGTVSETIIHPREVFKGAILANASGIVISHNHPSGTLEPSREDIATTARIKEAGIVIGIHVLDHVICTESGYYSFQEQGRL
jgi:DNA repair protein RadC